MQQDQERDFRPTLLACFPKHFSPVQESNAMEESSDLLLGKGIAARCVSAGDWFQKTFSKHGNWDSWIWETVHGKDYMTRAPHFHGFLVYGREVGRATANIVKTALQSGRVVLAHVDDSLYSVTDVAERDSNRWSDGWTLTLAAIGE